MSTFTTVNFYLTGRENNVNKNNENVSLKENKFRPNPINGTVIKLSKKEIRKLKKELTSKSSSPLTNVSLTEQSLTRFKLEGDTVQGDKLTIFFTFPSEKLKVNPESYSKILEKIKDFLN